MTGTDPRPEPTPGGASNDPTVHGELIDTSRAEDEGDRRREAVEEPAKLMRIGSMIKQLLEEVRGADLDEAARTRLKEIYETSLDELGSALSEDLRQELNRISAPFDGVGEAPSDAELRVAQAQLVGWLEGLFHGIQATLFAQQMSARAQLEDMRRQLPTGGPQVPGGPRGSSGLGEPGPGTYL